MRAVDVFLVILPQAVLLKQPNGCIFGIAIKHQMLQLRFCLTQPEHFAIIFHWKRAARPYKDRLKITALTSYLPLAEFIFS